MNTDELRKVFPLIKKQIHSLDLPWLENMVRKSTKERDPFKVLIATILSLRTQDKTTGAAAERLFHAAPDMQAISRLSVKTIEKAIYPVGFYKTKAVRIRALCKVLIDEHGSRVPDNLDELLKLNGVGRKTANLVITLGYSKPGICVDTHVHRITNRWGYVQTKSPEETEFALRNKLPRKYWIGINGILVAFGQNICKPISPLCSKCSIEDICGKNGVIKHR